MLDQLSVNIRKFPIIPYNNFRRVPVFISSHQALAHDVTHYLHCFVHFVVCTQYWYLECRPIPLFEPNVTCAAHGPSFAKLRYILYFRMVQDRSAAVFQCLYMQAYFMEMKLCQKYNFCCKLLPLHSTFHIYPLLVLNICLQPPAIAFEYTFHWYICFQPVQIDIS